MLDNGSIYTGSIIPHDYYIAIISVVANDYYVAIISVVANNYYIAIISVVANDYYAASIKHYYPRWAFYEHNNNNTNRRQCSTIVLMIDAGKHDSRSRRQ